MKDMKRTKDMEHMAERSRFADRAGQSKTATVTTRPGTAAGLGAGPGAQAWILSSMSLGSAAGLLSSGAIGDDYGRRRTFLAGTLLLAGSSVRSHRTQWCW